MQDAGGRGRGESANGGTGTEIITADTLCGIGRGESWGSAGRMRESEREEIRRKLISKNIKRIKNIIKRKEGEKEIRKHIK